MAVQRYQLHVEDRRYQLHLFDPVQVFCDHCLGHAAFRWRYAVIRRRDLRITSRGTWQECQRCYASVQVCEDDD